MEEIPSREQLSPPLSLHYYVDQYVPHRTTFVPTPFSSTEKYPDLKIESSPSRSDDGINRRVVVVLKDSAPSSRPSTKLFPTVRDAVFYRCRRCSGAPCLRARHWSAPVELVGTRNSQLAPVGSCTLPQLASGFLRVIIRPFSRVVK